MFLFTKFILEIVLCIILTSHKTWISNNSIFEHNVMYINMYISNNNKMTYNMKTKLQYSFCLPCKKIWKTVESCKLKMRLKKEQNVVYIIFHVATFYKSYYEQLNQF